MGQEITVTLDLSQPVMNFDNEPMKDLAKLKQGQSQDEAPILKRGTLLSAMLMNGIQSNDAKTRAKLNRLSKKVSKHNRDDGKWVIDAERLKEVRELLENVNPNSPYATAQYHGDIIDMFEEAELDLARKKKTKETTQS